MAGSHASTDEYAKKIGKTEVVYTHNDGVSYIALNILPPVLSLNTTKDYAQYVMDAYQGFELKAQLPLRGYSFKYVDNAPCVGVISYFDGINYTLFRSCGSNKAKDVKALLNEGIMLLNLKKNLEKSSKPTVY